MASVKRGLVAGSRGREMDIHMQGCGDDRDGDGVGVKPG